MKEVEILKDEIHDLKNRVLINERYLSNNSLIITDSPITKHRNETAAILYLHRGELLVSMDEKSLKACHSLKKLQDESAPPATILKFVHFRAKDTVYSLRKNLCK